ncbi:MAG: hypothetical protein KME45_24205 [Stenomitos rutilans HA7619-LM2]|jgi:hypothetical protein|nr:hypothetical protein [Stenomitos rutilans HA7619-LM2]
MLNVASSCGERVQKPATTPKQNTNSTTCRIDRKIAHTNEKSLVQHFNQQHQRLPFAFYLLVEGYPSGS